MSALQIELDSVNAQIKGQLDTALAQLEAAKRAVQEARATEKRKAEGVKAVRKLLRELNLTISDLNRAA